MNQISLFGLALASVVAVIHPLRADTVLAEDFSADPTSRGWIVHGDSSLFRWDAEGQNLAVTWDSSKGNSYFHLPLGTTLRATQEFELTFTVTLDDIEVGTTAGKPFTFQIALGLLNLAGATDPGFLRGTGFNSPNLLTWDYFPDSGFGATISSTIISEQHRWASSFNSPQPLDLATPHTFRLVYTPADRRLKTTMQNGGTVVPLQDVVLQEEFDGFSVDTLAVASFSDAGQDPQYAGSVLAHGVIDEVRFTFRQPAIQDFTGRFQDGVWQATFVGRGDHRYTLEFSGDLRIWTPLGEALVGTGAVQTIIDPRPMAPCGLYRLKADSL